MMQPSHHARLFGSIVNPTKDRRMRLAYDRLVIKYRLLPLSEEATANKVWRKLNEIWNNDAYWPITRHGAATK